MSQERCFQHGNGKVMCLVSSSNNIGCRSITEHFCGFSLVFLTVLHLCAVLVLNSDMFRTSKAILTKLYGMQRHAELPATQLTSDLCQAQCSSF